ncbi:S-adenosyl-L-methionine-dependentmethyltransferases superfamily protein, partial [Striga asiatica]
CTEPFGLSSPRTADGPDKSSVLLISPTLESPKSVNCNGYLKVLKRISLPTAFKKCDNFFCGNHEINLDVTIWAYQQIVWLQVPVNNIQRVQIWQVPAAYVSVVQVQIMFYVHSEEALSDSFAELLKVNGVSSCQRMILSCNDQVLELVLHKKHATNYVNHSQ